MFNAERVDGVTFGYNASFNGTSIGHDAGDDAAEKKPWIDQLLAQIYLVSLPLICVTGVVGNTLAFFIFVSKPMRRTSCSLYLATRSVADGGFLLATFITWSSDASRLRFFHTNGLCQVTIFLTFVFAFLSVWMTVIVTCENFIRICRPFSVSSFCNVRIAKICIACLVVLSLFMYNYPVWANQVYFIDRANVTYFWCDTKPRYESLVKWLSFWDLLITLVIPSLVIVILMIFITASLFHSLKRQTRLQGRSNGNAGDGNRRRSMRSSNSPQAKVTWMLFTVSLLFILLNSPSHIIRTKMAIVALVNGPTRSHVPTAEQKIQVVFQIIYYISFSVNLFVYLSCGDNFRKIFMETYLQGCLPVHRNSMSNEMTALTTVRLEENETRNDTQTAPLIHPEKKAVPRPDEDDDNNKNKENGSDEVNGNFQENDEERDENNEKEEKEEEEEEEGRDQTDLQTTELLQNKI